MFWAARQGHISAMQYLNDQCGLCLDAQNKVCVYVRGFFTISKYVRTFVDGDAIAEMPQWHQMMLILLDRNISFPLPSKCVEWEAIVV